MNTDRFFLWSKLKLHRQRLDYARRSITDWLEKVKNPYIAFSGGKDSTCVLHLVREQSANIPAVYFDADNCFPEIIELLEETPNLIKYKTDEPFMDTLSRFGFGAHESSRLKRAAMQSTVWGPIKRLIAEYHFDGVAYGLRAAESYGRRMNSYRGVSFQYKRDGLWACQPVIKWSYNDVWAYIFSHNIPYAGTYDKMWSMPEEEQRVSYWAGGTKRTYGRWAWLKKNYPELFNELAARFPEVRNYV